MLGYGYQISSFTGLHNRSKVKCWLYLQYIKSKGKPGSTIRDIHLNTGIPIRTLESSLNKWWSWQRIHKHLLPEPADDGCRHLWSIASSGIKYLSDTVPVDFYNECVQELRDHWDTLRAVYQRYDGIAWRTEAGYHVVYKPYKKARHDTSMSLPDNILVVKTPGEAYKIIIELSK